MNDNEKTPAEVLSGVTGKGFMPGQSGNPFGTPAKTAAHRLHPLPEDPSRGASPAAALFRVIDVDTPPD